MFESKTNGVMQNTAYISAQDLLNQHFFFEQHYCLFLDIDGTVSEFHVDPKQSFISKEIIENLTTLHRLGVMIIVITGRTVSDAQRLLSPLLLPTAGTHGLEIQLSSQSPIQRPKSDFDFNQLHLELEQVCLNYPQLRIEKKTYAVAIHFREQPHLSEIVKNIAENIAQQHPQIRLNAGKCVYELMLKDADKGQAILKLYQHFNLSNFIPIFIGDDQTDESGFSVINQLDGLSIKVGEGATLAQFRFKDVSTTGEFIQHFKDFIQNKSERQSQVSTVNGEKACLN